jgi:FkbM family methyltransferase
LLIASRFFRRFASKREAPTSAVAAGPADYERESLQALKDRLDRNLVIVDVGCRWGFAEAWDQLSPNVTPYGFDPDAEECERLRSLYKGKDVTLVAQALGSRSEERTLYFTPEPACSFLYKPDPVLTKSMPELHCASEIGSTTISLATLIEWALANDIPQIDFIKLDTQGAELDVLRGGEQSLAPVRALEMEVEFNPIYIGQPLFGDVDRYLRDRGFVLWKLSTFAHYSDRSYSGALPQPDHFFYDSEAVTRPTFAGQLFWGHAYYVRAEMAAAAIDERSRDKAQFIRDARPYERLGVFRPRRETFEAGIGTQSDFLRPLAPFACRDFLPPTIQSALAGCFRVPRSRLPALSVCRI